MLDKRPGQRLIIQRDFMCGPHSLPQTSHEKHMKSAVTNGIGPMLIQCLCMHNS